MCFNKFINFKKVCYIIQMMDEYIEIKEAADRLRLSVPRFRQILKIAREKKLIEFNTKLMINSKKVLYSSEMIQQLDDQYYLKRAFGVPKPRQRKNYDPKNDLKIIVHIRDSDTITALKSSFGSTSSMEEFCIYKLTEKVKSALEEIRELKRKHNAELEEVLANHTKD